MKQSKLKNLSGIFESCVIPFGENSQGLDVAKLREVLDYVFQHGGRGQNRVCFINPAIAELETLNDPERRIVLQTMVEIAGNDVAVGAQGAIKPTLEGEIALGKEAKNLGASVFKFVPPRLKRGTTARENFQAAATIMQSVDMPCLLYNSSSFGGTPLLASDVVKLADQFDNFVIFETGELAYISYLKNVIKNRVSCAAISEASGLMSMTTRGNGYFSGNPLMLVQSVKLYRMLANGLYSKASRFYSDNYELFSIGNFPFPPTEAQPITAKYCLNAIGMNVGPTRKPLTYPPRPEHVREYNRVLAKYSLLKRGKRP